MSRPDRGWGAHPIERSPGSDDHGECSVPPEETALMPRSHAPLPIHHGPPPEVLEEIGEAWERAQDADPDLQLDFESEPRLARAWGVLRRGDGTVIERVPAAVAVALACGDVELWPPDPLPV